MKIQILVSLLFGAFIGSLATYFTTRGAGDNLHAVVTAKGAPSPPHKAGADSSSDQSASGGEESPSDDSEGPRDMSDPIQRDICISYWYFGMRRVVGNLEIQTGHKFKPVAKLSADPVEILEEQAAFMKTFLAETDRLYPREK